MAWHGATLRIWQLAAVCIAGLAIAAEVIIINMRPLHARFGSIGCMGSSHSLRTIKPKGGAMLNKW